MRKTKFKITTVTLIILMSSIFSGIVLAQSIFEKESWDRSTYIRDEIIVKFRDDIRPFRVIKVPEGKVGEKVREYLSRRDVVFAEPNYIAYALMVPNDPYYDYQWHLDNAVYGGIQAEEAWDVSTGSGVKVAILDTGIAYEDYRESWWRRYYRAPDLANTCFVAGHDFVNNDSHANDDNSHGTHVAGTVAQSTNNGTGVAGVAFDSCLMPVKVLDKNGSGTYAQVADGIYWAVDHGADIINLSLGGSSPAQTLEDAVAYAYNHGVTVVAAAGNNGSSSIDYPAAYNDYVIAVGATRYDETLAYYSSYGLSLDLVAPGGDLNIDQNSDGYDDGVLQNTFNPNTKRTNDFGYWFFQGTSMASPHVSGAAALLISNGTASNPDEVRTILQEAAKDLGTPGWDETFGWGLINAYQALQWTSGPACTVDSDCDDGVACTTDNCVSGECINTPGDSYCSSDGWFDTGDTKWVPTGQCTEKEQKEQEYKDYYCHLTLGCQYNVTNTQWIDTGATRNKVDGTSCDDGLYCNVGEICQTGVCTGGATRDCGDGESCTIDTCNEDLDKCENIWPACGINDGCCGPDCNSINDPDCAAGVLCWSADYQYLYRHRSQIKKFCKCAQGTYGYNNYSYSWGRATVYYYTDSGNNENWNVTFRSSYLPVYQVQCTDGLNYLTNQDYYYGQ